MDAIPILPGAQPDSYDEDARALAAAVRGGREALRAWAVAWLETLAARGLPPSPWGSHLERVERVLDAALGEPRGGLAAARRLIARAHGFDAWAKLRAHLAALRRARDPANVFESAVEAVVDGDVKALRAILRRDPAVVRRRSARMHRSTLLHYVSANGVEDYRQRTPANIVAVARLLLDAGASVNAPQTSHGHGNGGTTLGLVATSVHPEKAGVQDALLEILWRAGADVDGLPDGWHPLEAALANGQPGAAAWLAAHGARLTIVGAAGVGRLDAVDALLAWERDAERLAEALVYAAGYGHPTVVARLIDHGVDLAARGPGGQTALHLAAHVGHLDVVELLLARKAPLEVKNDFGGTVLGQALWSAVHEPAEDHLAIVERLLAAGADVEPAFETGIDRIDCLLRAARA